MKTYDFFTDYYDEIIRWNGYSLDDEIFLIDELIEKNSFWAVDILEVACGTGVVAKQLEKKWYNVIGLDISEKMLEKAEKIFSKEKLILWDMTNFDLEKEFDVVLCNNNSINHLLTLEDWEKFFDMAKLHLKKWWILIFDILTIFEFENITRDFRWFFNVWKDTICLEMFKKDNNIFQWLVKMFIYQNDKFLENRYKLIEEQVSEVSFEIDFIKEILEKHNFEIVKTEDYHKWIVDKNSERVYFVAKKK